MNFGMVSFDDGVDPFVPLDGENGGLGGLELKTWNAACGRRSGDMACTALGANGGSDGGFDGDPCCRIEPAGFVGEKLNCCCC